MGPPPKNRIHTIASSLVKGKEKGSFFETGLVVSFDASSEMSRVSAARELLEQEGVSGPDELKIRYPLPEGLWIFLSCGSDWIGPAAQKLSPLHAALILGLCGVSLYSSDRPVVWSEARLARQLILIRPSTFYEDQA